MIKLGLTRRSKILLMVIILLFFNYLLAPLIVTIKYFQKLNPSPDAKEAISSLAKMWQISGRTLIYSERTYDYGAKSLAVFDPFSLSSAMVWIPREGLTHLHSLNLISDKPDIHLVGQFRPRDIRQYIIARNFYGNAGILFSKAVILDIKGNAFLGDIVAESTANNELRYPYILTFPIPILAFNLYH